MSKKTITTPQELVASLIDIFPSFEQKWDNGESFGYDGDYSFHSVFLFFGPMCYKLLSEGTAKQQDRFCTLLNLCVAQGGKIENAVSTCFLEAASQLGFRKIIKPHLSPEAKQQFMKNESQDQEIEIRNYFDPIKANLDKELLEKEGIKCYLQNINLSNMNWLYTNAIGGIKLIINKSDLEKANEIIKVFESEIPGEIGNIIKCPVCNSLEIRIINPKWLIGLLFILIAFLPSPFKKRKYQCNSCGHKWEIEEKKNEE